MKMPTPQQLAEALLAILTPRFKALEERLAAIPASKDGPTQEQILGMVTEALKSLKPKDGDPGRDALQIEILPRIDQDRSYPRGTYASHQGGVVRAARTTDYLDTLKAGETVETKGWQIVLNGVHEHSIEQLDERTFAIKSVMTSGAVVEKRVALPAVLDRGVFRDGTKYAKGDAVTYGGSLWIGQADEPPGKPGDVGSGWRLAVKKGRDGKDLNGHR